MDMITLPTMPCSERGHRLDIRYMDKLIEGIGSNIVVVIAIICYAIYEICALQKQPTKAEKYAELKLLHELLEKGIITQEEFNDRKGEILD